MEWTDRVSTLELALFYPPQLNPLSSVSASDLLSVRREIQGRQLAFELDNEARSGPCYSQYSWAMIKLSYAGAN